MPSRCRPSRATLGSSRSRGTPSLATPADRGRCPRRASITRAPRESRPKRVPRSACSISGSCRGSRAWSRSPGSKRRSATALRSPVGRRSRRSPAWSRPKTSRPWPRWSSRQLRAAAEDPDQTFEVHGDSSPIVIRRTNLDDSLTATVFVLATGKRRRRRRGRLQRDTCRRHLRPWHHHRQRRDRLRMTSRRCVTTVHDPKLATVATCGGHRSPMLMKRPGDVVGTVRRHEPGDAGVCGRCAVAGGDCDLRACRTSSAISAGMDELILDVEYDQNLPRDRSPFWRRGLVVTTFVVIFTGFVLSLL